MSNTKDGHPLHLLQHPIDAMLQFDANAHANVDASVNGPLGEKDNYICWASTKISYGISSLREVGLMSHPT